MFSITVPYKDIGPVRPALSSFAAQTTTEKLLEEAEKVIKPGNELHVTLSNSKQTGKKIEWTDLGATTLQKIQMVIQKHQPLTWDLITKLAARPPNLREGVKVVRRRRPPELVGLHFITQIL